MEPNQPISQPAEFTSTPRKRGKKRSLTIAVIIFLLVAAGIFGYSRMQSGSTSEISPTPEVFPSEEPTPTEIIDESPTPEAEETPDPTEKPTPAEKAAPTKASELNIQVLNGTGEAGIAATAKEFLSGKGYESIETGNADNNEYTGVTLKSKSSAADYLEEFKTDLEEKYTVSDESDTLSEDSLFDVVIIIGK